MALALHKFGVGERVELSPSRTDGNTPAGTYTIVRQLPDETNDRHYRVKNARDGHERVVRESQLGRMIGARAR